MKFQELRTVLEKRNYRSDSYSLGKPRDESYCLENLGSQWAVYYSERGLQSGKKTFDSEEEACNYFLDLIERDPTTKA